MDISRDPQVGTAEAGCPGRAGVGSRSLGFGRAGSRRLPSGKGAQAAPREAGSRRLVRGALRLSLVGPELEGGRVTVVGHVLVGLGGLRLPGLVAAGRDCGSTSIDGRP